MVSKKSNLPRLTVFSGKVVSEEKGAVENAKVEFISLEKIVLAHTGKDGTFSMKIPSRLIDGDNVVRVSFNKINPEKGNILSGFQATDLILTQKEIENPYLIKAEPLLMIMGEVAIIAYDNEDPVVIDNGVEIGYKDFLKAMRGKKSSCDLKNNDYYYFEPEKAMALYGEKAKKGLYLLVDKPEK